IKSPLDSAILTHRPEARSDYVKIDEIPFDFERRMLSIVVSHENDQPLLITKGAPESVISVCTTHETQDGEAPLDDAEREQCEKTYGALSAEGFRVLAVARRRLGSLDNLTTADEREMTLVGFLTFIDPPREDAKSSLDALRRDGVRVIILTGDNEL